MFFVSFQFGHWRSNTFVHISNVVFLILKKEAKLTCSYRLEGSGPQILGGKSSNLST